MATTRFDRRAFLFAALASWLAGASRGDAMTSNPVAESGGLANFERRFAGTVFRPDTSDYARLSKIYQARATARPALFAHCTSADDVRRAVLAAREAAAPLSVRCGGHSYAGHSLNDGGVVLDLSGLRSIEIAADGGSATVGGGTLAGMIDRATAAKGRATTLGQCPTVGIGGLALGGGVGPLMGRLGLTCDNLLSAQIVLADGRVVTASEEADGDLFWAIRGGGGNFGVATRLTFRLHPVTLVTGGFVTLRSADPRAMLHLYADLCAAAPDDLVMLGMLVPDDEGRPLLMIQVCHLGSPEQAAADIAPLVASPYVIENGVGRLPYADLQTQGPPEMPLLPSTNRAGFRAAFDEVAIDTLARALAEAPGPYMHGLVPLHGAVTATEQSKTAFPLRERGIAYGLTSIIAGPESLSPTRAWIAELNDSLRGSGPGAYVNVMGDEGAEAVKFAYGDNFTRLLALKNRYDPANIFRNNQNIRREPFH
ncbi:FAD-binding oxidoreductase [Sphingopyxis sp. PAMC25046]|uniref:FAD-binding oxidoreductase n=1 Tax=Sphingopyxis sp. PAMC25046 TaxID=2565556 RepID=UPI00109D9C3F|nr:FAD-binding oxidoreductase [Sphingopyxis sp. PAMC25046]QCB55616.1 FAD-binding oxidoreductase [Sphingopyxis sp. PAMC25046]